MPTAKRAFAALPGSVRESYFRGDSACWDRALVNWLRDFQSPWRPGSPWRSSAPHNAARWLGPNPDSPAPKHATAHSRGEYNSPGPPATRLGFARGTPGRETRTGTCVPPPDSVTRAPASRPGRHPPADVRRPPNIPRPARAGRGWRGGTAASGGREPAGAESCFSREYPGIFDRIAGHRPGFTINKSIIVRYLQCMPLLCAC